VTDLILLTIKKKDWKNVTRQEYLKMVYECIDVLNGTQRG
jgi:hypothetical protein